MHSEEIILRKVRFNPRKARLMVTSHLSEILHPLIFCNSIFVHAASKIIHGVNFHRGTL